MPKRKSRKAKREFSALVTKIVATDKKPMPISRPEDVPDWVTNFWPQFSRILPNGNLRMNVSGQGEVGEDGLSGEKIDGALEIAPDYPDYEEWRQIIVKAK